MHDIAIRSAIVEDISGITDVWETALAPTYHRDLLPDSRQRFQAWAKSYLDEPKKVLLVAALEGVIVGYCVGEITEETTGQSGYIHHLAIASNYRRCGVGQRLMNEMEGQLAPYAERFAVSVHIDNEAAQTLVRRRGYQLTYNWFEKDCLPK